MRKGAVDRRSRPVVEALQLFGCAPPLFWIAEVQPPPASQGLQIAPHPIPLFPGIRRAGFHPAGNTISIETRRACIGEDVGPQPIRRA